MTAGARQALRAADAGTPTAAFERLLEATILLSGLAFENGGLSVAHSLTRGTSALHAIHEHGALHGEEVAFGAPQTHVRVDRLALIIPRP